jgi:2-hydroxy-6-oxonona-2,4-dienedioate hydrolase
MSLKRETYYKTARASYYTRIYFSHPVDSGKESVVLVHGLGISGSYMHMLALELARKYTVYVPDLPGFGNSSKPPHVLNIPELADALYDWAVAANPGKAYYLGNSTGCQVIVDFTINYTDMVKGVILQGPTIDPYYRSVPEQLGSFVRNTPGEPSTQMLNMVKDYSKCGLRRVKKTFEFALLYETEKYLPEVKVPALVVRGSEDMIISPEWASQAAEILPEGDLKIISGAAHTINVSMPKELATVTEEFIETINVKKYESAIS